MLIPPKIASVSYISTIFSTTEPRPTTHSGNFESHEQNLTKGCLSLGIQDQLPSAVDWATGQCQSNAVFVWAVTEAGSAIHRTSTESSSGLCVSPLSSEQTACQGFPRETQLPGFPNPRRQETASCPFNPLCLCVYVWLWMHHFSPPSGRHVLFPPTWKEWVITEKVYPHVDLLYSSVRVTESLDLCLRPPRCCPSDLSDIKHSPNLYSHRQGILNQSGFTKGVREKRSPKIFFTSKKSRNELFPHAQPDGWTALCSVESQSQTNCNMIPGKLQGLEKKHAFLIIGVPTVKYDSVTFFSSGYGLRSNLPWSFSW